MKILSFLAYNNSSKEINVIILSGDIINETIVFEKFCYNCKYLL